MSPHHHRYAGSELEIFQHARNWKRYWTSLVHPYLRGDVLEVGAGIGANTPLLNGSHTGKWFCLEPDETLARSLHSATRNCDVAVSTIDAVTAQPRFDTILYIDVLEHIEADREELTKAALRLRPGGNLVVLSPAHQWLFSPFDDAIGHRRRYSKRSLTRLTPDGLRLKRMQYLDTAGIVLSLANRWMLKSRLPTHSQIGFWDETVVPVSRVLDRITGHNIGKSILAVWGKISR